MFKKILLPIMVLIVSGGIASAEDWVGQTPPPPVNGTLGPYSSMDFFQTENLIEACTPGFTPPPCGPGQALAYTGSPVFPHIPSLPAGAGPGSNVGVMINGAFADPSSSTGISNINGLVPLAAFAMSSSVDALSATTNALSAQLNSLGGTVTGLAGTVNGLSTQMQTLSIDLAQVQQQLALQDRSLRQGVAMSLAMDGTGTLGPDEHFAMSMNWGTFGGQNGVAGSIAIRAADHVTFDGGVGTGLHGGLVGARAGVRIAW